MHCYPITMILVTSSSVFPTWARNRQEAAEKTQLPQALTVSVTETPNPVIRRSKEQLSQTLTISGMAETLETRLYCLYFNP